MSAALCCHCLRCEGRTYRRVTDFLAAHRGTAPIDEAEIVDAPVLAVVKNHHQQLRLFGGEHDG